jgi:dCMP deaminase
VTGRPGWDEYFLHIAEAVSTRADCTRRKVGAVVVRDNRIVSCGYNGAPAGRPGCLTDGACPRGRQGFEHVPPGSSYDTGDGACISVHAEANALLYADRDHCVGASLYCTDDPCDGCLRLILGAGITWVVTPSGRTLL